MPQEFRYPLTRICLRSGRLTLPQTMLELFPTEGSVTAFDSRRGGDAETFELTVEGPRRIAGLGTFFADNDLEVNDALLIRPLEDGRYALTAVRRPRKLDTTRPDVVQALLDDIVEAATPLTEREIRSVFPDLPAEFDLAAALGADGRLHRVEGRWRPLSYEAEPAPPTVVEDLRQAARADEAVVDEAVVVAVEAEAPQARAAVQPTPIPTPQPPPPTVELDASTAPTSVEGPETIRVPAPPTAAPAAPGDAAPTPWMGVVEEPAPSAAGETSAVDAAAEVAAAADAPAPATPDVVADTEAVQDAPVASTTARSARSGAPRESRRVTVTPYPRGVMFPSEVALNSEQEPGDLSLVQRARAALLDFGFRVDSLAHGQLLAHAELGRYQYRVLVHTLPDRERIDWAGLMAKRRETAAKYLAVIGDVRDLQRLFAPADMARATLWSWDGLARVRDLSHTVLISPIDLEPHFERDGMFEGGLVRFERTVEERIRERGAFSAVLTRLAALKAPAIFVLDDLVGDVDLTRDQLLRVIERLTEAPFHLVIRVGNGEFCLRNRVGDALLNVSEYALSLRDRLPLRTRDRVVAVAEPGSIDPIVDPSAEDEPPDAAEGMRAEPE